MTTGISGVGAAQSFPAPPAPQTHGTSPATAGAVQKQDTDGDADSGSEGVGEVDTRL